MISIRHALAASLLVIGAAASAQEATSDEWMKVTTQKTRAEVMAARTKTSASASTFPRIELAFMSQPSVRERAAVKLELAQAKASGEYGQINAEAPSFGPAQSSRSFFARRK